MEDCYVGNTQNHFCEFSGGGDIYLINKASVPLVFHSMGSVGSASGGSGGDGSSTSYFTCVCTYVIVS